MAIPTIWCPWARSSRPRPCSAPAKVPVQWHVSRGIGHGIAPDGLQIGGLFPPRRARRRRLNSAELRRGGVSRCRCHPRAAPEQPGRRDRASRAARYRRPRPASGAARGIIDRRLRELDRVGGVLHLDAEAVGDAHLHAPRLNLAVGEDPIEGVDRPAGHAHRLQQGAPLVHGSLPGDVVQGGDQLHAVAAGGRCWSRSAGRRQAAGSRPPSQNLRSWLLLPMASAKYPSRVWKTP